MKWFSSLQDGEPLLGEEPFHFEQQEAEEKSHWKLQVPWEV
jgi:hypothetical protein